ncbi:MAG: NAD(+)/NADH kinase [Anaerolineales bacterium]|nr:NAD(+)/NADH kinase [Anaerolineales bacterium]
MLADHGADVIYGRMDDPDIRAAVEEGSVDLMVALGGDGTMLRAGHLCAPVDVPVIGVHLGSFGFLTEIQEDQWQSALPRIFSDHLWYERRMMLRVELWRNDQRLGSWEALNEAFVGHGPIKRPAHLEVSVDGHPLATYVTDGLIVATPTGSTAYALAAGGPILPPELRNILVVPVAPHLAIDRAIVLAEGSSIDIMLRVSYQGVLSVDGQEAIEIDKGDHVQVCASDHTVRFARLQDPAYFYRNIGRYLNRNPFAGIE